MDAWLAALKRAGVRTLDLALVGRWIGHLAQGRLAHEAIAQSPPVQAERALGWLTHYAVGVAFAGLLLALEGSAWLQAPTPGPALALGVATTIVPLFVMQPAMGAGFAASRTPTPLRNSLRSLVNHAVFGAGLWLSAVALEALR
jgi:hypothetical protein